MNKKLVEKIINLKFELNDHQIPFNLEITKIHNGYMISRFYVKHFKDIHTVIDLLITEQQETPYGAVYNAEKIDKLLSKINQ